MNFDKQMEAFTRLDIDKKNLQNPEVTPEIIEQCTNRSQVIMAQLMSIQQRQEQGAFSLIKSATSGYHSFTPEMGDVALTPQNRVGISTLTKNINSVMKEKFFLCRTITPASKAVALETIVDDPLGTHAVRLALYNYSEVKVGAEVFKDILPMGSYLAIKNPWFKSTASGGLSIRSDNPADIALLNEKEAMEIVSDWKAEIPDQIFQVFPGSCCKPFWNSLSNDSKELKGIGNRLFLEKLFTDAIRLYDLGLKCAKEEGDVEVLKNNKAAALLGLGCWNKASECLEDVLKINPGNAKAIYRMVVALVGLMRYEEGADFLEAKMTDFPELLKNPDLIKMAVVCKRNLRLKHNPSELKQYLWKLYIDEKPDDFLPQFIGSIEVGKVKGKGRGLVATKNLKPGEIVAVSRAFANIEEPNDKQQLYASLNFDRNSAEMKPCHGKVVGLIANKIYFDKQLGKEFYKLTAGKDLGNLEPEDAKNEHVDVKRIDAAVSMNSFGTDLQNEEENGTGIWILPSYFNHSCSEINCFYQILGEFMFVQTTKGVKKGEELHLLYVDLRKDLEERKKTFKSHEFVCSCKLCQLDAGKAGTEYRQESNRMLQELESMLTTEKPNLQKIMTVVQKLTNLRSDNPKLNMALINNVLIRATVPLFCSGKYFDKLIPLFEKMLLVAESYFPMCSIHITITANIILCNLSLGELGKVEKWIAKLKELLLKWFGSLEFLKKVENANVMKHLADGGIDFFA